MAEVLEHAALPDNVAHALGPDHWRPLAAKRAKLGLGLCWLTLVFANILEGKRQAGVFALDDANLAKCAPADNPQKTKVVEADWKSFCQQRERERQRERVCVCESGGSQRAASILASSHAPSPSRSPGFPWLLPMVGCCRTAREKAVSGR